MPWPLRLPWPQQKALWADGVILSGRGQCHERGNSAARSFPSPVSLCQGDRRSQSPCVWLVDHFSGRTVAAHGGGGRCTLRRSRDPHEAEGFEEAQRICPCCSSGRSNRMPQTGWLNQNPFFLTIWRLGIPRSRYWQIWCLLRALFLAYNCPSSPFILT